MDKYSQIKEAIRKIAQVGSTGNLFVQMEVVSISGDSCSAKIDNLVLSDIRLAAPDSNNKGILVKPSVGSIILVSDLSGGDLRLLQVVGYSAIDSIVIQGGNNGGLVKVDEMVKWMDQVYNDIANIAIALKTPCVQGVAIAPAFVQASAKPQSSVFSNDLIKH